MRAIIIGAGNTGRLLASRLCEEKHDVVLVDHRPKPLTQLESELDIMTLHGHGADPKVLKTAGLGKANLIVAGTSSDEVNICICMQAKRAGVGYKVARISNPNYIQQTALFDPAEVGIDLPVNPPEACARDIAHMLSLPGAHDVINLLSGEILATVVQLDANSPMLKYSLNSFPKPELLKTVRIIAVHRKHQILIPHGNTKFEADDSVCIVGHISHIRSFLNWALPNQSQLERVVIAGGSQLTHNLARRLSANKRNVTIVAKSAKQAEECAANLPKTRVINANPMTPETLAELSLADRPTAFVSAMQDDEDNIIAGLLAGKNGAKLSIAQVSQPEYVPVINTLSLLDRAVSTHLSTIDAILHFVRGKNLKAVSTLRHIPGELFESVLEDQHAWSQKCIKDLHVPDGAIIACVTRDNHFCTPTGDLVLQSGDRVIMYASPNAGHKVKKLFKRS